MTYLEAVSRGPALTAEDVILLLCGVLLGDGCKDRGLMSHIVDGGQHIERCQIGMWIEAGDSLRGGQPCSKRCQGAREALNAAERWLKAHEQPHQLGLPEVSG